MTRKEMRELEEAEVEAALRREVAEVQAWDAARRKPATTAAVRASGILGSTGTGGSAPAVAPATLVAAAPA